MQFGEYLEDLIRKRNLSINALSNECKINRGGLYSVFKNQRKLKADQLFELIAKLGLTATEEKELTELYFKNLYGKEDYDKIIFLINQMQSFLTVQESSPAKSLISNEITEKLKIFLNENSKVITNFPFSFTQVDSLFYNAVKGGSLTEFIHILFLDEKDNYRYNYSSVFKSLKYMYFLQFPYYFYTSISSLGICSFLPYFTIGDNTAILFSKEKAIAINEPKAVKALYTEAHKLIQNSKKFGTHSIDVLQIKDEYQKGLLNNATTISISSYPCLAQFVDHETMKSVVRQELPNSDMLVELAYSHYSSMYSKTHQINIVSESGVKRFAEIGNFCEITGDIIHYADIEHRIKVLEKVIEAIENDTFFLLDKNKISIPSGFMIEKYANKAIFYLMDEGKDNFALYEHFMAQFEDLSFVKAVSLAAQYLIQSRKVCAKEYSVQFVNNLIAGLRTQM